jgi:hypothetical protein
MRERHFGRIATQVVGTEDVTVDVGALVRRLLLFEHCFIESIALQEIPALVRVFGYEGLMALLDSPGFDVIADNMTAGSIGQTGTLQVTQRRGGLLPLGSYRICGIGLANRDDWLRRGLDSIHEIRGLPRKKANVLEQRLQDTALSYPVEAIRDGITDFQHELETVDPVMRRTIATTVRNEIGLDVTDGLQIAVEDLGMEGDYRVRTNLIDTFGLDEQEAHRLIERALLGVAGLRQRLHLMRFFDALTGFREEEVPIFEASLDFLAEQLDPGTQEHRFDRVVTVAGLPSLADLPEGHRVDAVRLLELRDTDECRELRGWLRDVDSETDEEINSRFDSIRERLAAVTHSQPGEVLRFVMTNAAGAVPGVGLAAGPLASLADRAIVEKLIGKPGPVSFLSREYRSLFSDS